jgi:hypothetical protein
MNKYIEKIVAYIDGNMTDDERTQFEKIISSDTGVQKEIEEIKKSLSAMKTDSTPEVEETYFINLLPEFYQRQTGKKKFKLRKLTYYLSPAAAAIILMFIFYPGKTTNLDVSKDLSQEITESDLNEVLNPYETTYSLNDLMSFATSTTDSIVNNLVSDELDISSKSVDKMLTDNYTNTNELLNSLDENQANELYSQLINKDIIKGAR